MAPHNRSGHPSIPTSISSSGRAGGGHRSRLASFTSYRFLLLMVMFVSVLMILSSTLLVLLLPREFFGEDASGDGGVQGRGRFARHGTNSPPGLPGSSSSRPELSLAEYLENDNVYFGALERRLEQHLSQFNTAVKRNSPESESEPGNVSDRGTGVGGEEGEVEEPFRDFKLFQDDQLLQRDKTKALLARKSKHSARHARGAPRSDGGASDLVDSSNGRVMGADNDENDTDGPDTAQDGDEFVLTSENQLLLKRATDELMKKCSEQRRGGAVQSGKLQSSSSPPDSNRNQSLAELPGQLLNVLKHVIRKMAIAPPSASSDNSGNSPEDSRVEQVGAIQLTGASALDGAPDSLQPQGPRIAFIVAVLQEHEDTPLAPRETNALQSAHFPPSLNTLLAQTADRYELFVLVDDAAVSAASRTAKHLEALPSVLARAADDGVAGHPVHLSILHFNASLTAASAPPPKVAGRSRVLHVPAPYSPSSGVARALDTLQSPYVSWVSDFSLSFEPFAAATLSDALDEYTDADVAFADVHELPSGKPSAALLPEELNPAKPAPLPLGPHDVVDYPRMLLLPPRVSSFAVRRRCLFSAGGLSADADASLGGAEWDYWLRMRERCGAFLHIPKSLCSPSTASASNPGTPSNSSREFIRDHSFVLSKVSERLMGRANLWGILDAFLLDPSLALSYNRSAAIAISQLRASLVVLQQLFAMRRDGATQPRSSAELVNAATLLSAAGELSKACFVVSQHRPESVPAVVGFASGLNLASTAAAGPDASAQGTRTQIEALLGHLKAAYPNLHTGILDKAIGAAVKGRPVEPFTNAGVFGARTEFAWKRRMYQQSYTWSALEHRHRVLLVVPDEPVIQLLRKFPSPSQLMAFVNPMLLFDEVIFLSPFEKGRREKIVSLDAFAQIRIVPLRSPQDLRTAVSKYSVSFVLAFGGQWACDVVAYSAASLLGLAPVTGPSAAFRSPSPPHQRVRTAVLLRHPQTASAWHGCILGFDFVLATDAATIDSLQSFAVDRDRVFPFSDPSSGQLRWDGAAASFFRHGRTADYLRKQTGPAAGARRKNPLKHPDFGSFLSSLQRRVGKQQLRVTTIDRPSSQNGTLGALVSAWKLLGAEYALIIAEPMRARPAVNASGLTEGTGEAPEEPRPAARTFGDTVDERAREREMSMSAFAQMIVASTTSAADQLFGFIGPFADTPVAEYVESVAVLSDVLVFLNPSTGATPIMEALSLGLVVVAADTHPFNVVIQDGFNGLLVRERQTAHTDPATQANVTASYLEPADLAETIRRAATDSHLRQRISASGPSSLLRFTLGKMEMERAAVLRALLESDVPPAPRLPPPTVRSGQAMRPPSDGQTHFAPPFPAPYSKLTEYYFGDALCHFRRVNPTASSLFCDGKVYTSWFGKNGWLLPLSHAGHERFSSPLLQKVPLASVVVDPVTLAMHPPVTPYVLNDWLSIQHCVSRFYGFDHASAVSFSDITVAAGAETHYNFITRIGRSVIFHRVRKHLRGFYGCRPQDAVDVYSVEHKPDTAPFVNFLISNYNQGEAFVDLIQELVLLQRYAGEKRMRVIVVDYGSTDVDVDKALAESGLVYKLRVIQEPYSRAGGLQAAAELVPSKDEIVFTLDTWIVLPPNVLDLLRLHCELGTTGYAPVIFRLRKGAPLVAADSTGFLESFGWGMLGLYARDLFSVGGYNTTKYKNVRGGEDDDFAGRLLWSPLRDYAMYDAKMGAKPFSFVRTQAPMFFHLWHPPIALGSWNDVKDTWSHLLPDYRPPEGVEFSQPVFRSVSRAFEHLAREMARDGLAGLSRAIEL